MISKFLKPYLNLISNRAAGLDQTPAQKMRKFVMKHEKYNFDSFVSEDICHDLINEIFL